MTDNQLIITLIGIAVLLLIAFAVAILLRKRNESRLAALEERKEELYNLPVNDEVEVVKNMHLIGQSQVALENGTKNGLIYLLTHLRILRITSLKLKVTIAHSVS